MEKCNQVYLHPYSDQATSPRYGWMNDYLFEYSDPTKIYAMFEDINKEITLCDFGTPLIITHDSLTVRNLVVQIFANVIKVATEVFDMAKFGSTIFKKVIADNYTVRICDGCDAIIDNVNTSGKCATCFAKHKYKTTARKVERPSYEQLLTDLNVMTCVKVSAKYGVAEATIRKWIKMYEKYGE